MNPDLIEALEQAAAMPTTWRLHPPVVTSLVPHRTVHGRGQFCPKPVSGGVEPVRHRTDPEFSTVAVAPSEAVEDAPAWVLDFNIAVLPARWLWRLAGRVVIRRLGR